MDTDTATDSTPNLPLSNPTDRVRDTPRVDDSLDLTQQMEGLRLELAAVEAERDESKAQYDTLVGKVSLMKLVFTKMKLAQAELEQVQREMLELLEENQALSDEITSLRQDVASLTEKLVASESKIATVEEKSEVLNSECDSLSLQLKQSERHLETLRDEKYSLENSFAGHQKKLTDLRHQLELSQVAADEHQRNVRELELKVELVEASAATAEEERGQWEQKYLSLQSELEKASSTHEQSIASLNQQVNHQKQAVAEVQAEKAKLQEELELHLSTIDTLKQLNTEIDQLKQEVQVKQLQIGKLRHEAIILNEHLTKLLTQLKEQLGDELGRVDKELITNLIIQFLQFPRGDSKKFETLLLIALTLTWDDTQKVAAGLLSGATTDKPKQKPSLVGLWTDFLDKELKK